MIGTTFDIFKWLTQLKLAKSTVGWAEKGFNVPWTKKYLGKGINPRVLEKTQKMRMSQLIRGAASQKPIMTTIGLGKAGKSGVLMQEIPRGAMGKVAMGKAAGVGLKLFYAKLYAGLAIAPAAGFYRFITERAKQEKGLEMGGFFPETQHSFTSRQRSVQAISSSRLQARSAIGGEAFLMHR